MDDYDEYLDEDLDLTPNLGKKEEKTVVIEAPKAEEKPKVEIDYGNSKLFVVRTTANREDQVFEFLESNIEQKKILIHTIFRAHGMRGYIFIETDDIANAQRAVYGVPYARGLLPSTVAFEEVDSMLDTGKRDINIKRNDVVEIIAGPFKRESAKVTRLDKQKEEVVVELLEAAVSIPITLKFDAVKVIRRDDDE